MSNIFEALEPGQQFKLTPTSRVTWLMFGGYKHFNDRVQVDAVRCDSEIGKRLLAWMAAGSDLKQLPASRMEVMEHAKHFYRDDLVHATLTS